MWWIWSKLNQLSPLPRNLDPGTWKRPVSMLAYESVIRDTQESSAIMFLVGRLRGKESRTQMHWEEQKGQYREAEVDPDCVGVPGSSVFPSSRCIPVLEFSWLAHLMTLASWNWVSIICKQDAWRSQSSLSRALDDGFSVPLRTTSITCHLCINSKRCSFYKTTYWHLLENCHKIIMFWEQDTLILGGRDLKMFYWLTWICLQWKEKCLILNE